MSPIFFFTLGLFGLTLTIVAMRGGPWHKAAGAALGAAWVVSQLLPFDFRSPPWGAIVADALVFLFLLYGVVRTRRVWLQVAAGFQFLVLATHYVFVTDQRLEQWAYVSAYYVWNIALIVTLLVSCLPKNRNHPL